MTLRLQYPIPMEPARAAAHARWRNAPKGQRKRARMQFEDETAAALRRSMEARA